MRNIELSIEGDSLTLKIDLSQKLGFTRSGESIAVASTDGNLQLWQDGKPREEFVNLNIFKRRPRDESDRRFRF